MKRLRGAFVLFCATGAGSGYVPWMPGTVGSLVGLGVYLILLPCAPLVYLGIAGALTCTAVWVSGAAAALVRHPDPPQVVIDEICGMLITLAVLPKTWPYVLGGFLLFRLFDILKPFPANRINADMSGGAGIVLDDVVAGIYANLVLQAAHAIF